MPDGRSSRTVLFKFETIAERLRELAFLNSQVKLRIVDLREQERARRDVPLQGRARRIREVHRRDPAVDHEESFLRAGRRQGRGRTGRWRWKSSFQYNDQYSENIFTYVNNINTHEGGTHLVGFRTALTRSLNTYAYKNGLLKEGGHLAHRGRFPRGIHRRPQRESARAAVRGTDEDEAGQQRDQEHRRGRDRRAALRPGSTRIPATRGGSSRNPCVPRRRAKRRARRATSPGGRTR